jgi:hypothetical protein
MMVPFSEEHLFEQAACHGSGRGQALFKPLCAPFPYFDPRQCAGAVRILDFYFAVNRLLYPLP